MSHYHLYAIGNALVDAEYDVSDEQLQTMGVDKRHMTLIDTPQRAELLKHVVYVSPKNKEAKSLLAETFDHLGFASDASFEDTVRWFLEDDVLSPA